jgi:hypothetical protein
VLPGINVYYLGMERQTDGTYIVRYDVSGTKANDLTSVDLALPRNINIVDMPDSYKLSEPGQGALVGNNKWGKDFWEQRILSGPPQDTGDGTKLFFFKVTSGGEAIGGININATRGRTQTCSTTVPSSYAQEAVIATKTVITEDGTEICVQADPRTQCETVVDCDTGVALPSIPVQEALKIGDHPVTYVAVPGEPCQTFIVDDGVPGATRYYCSGGRCVPVNW